LLVAVPLLQETYEVGSGELQELINELAAA
jgi:hypothetical protein